MAKAVTKACFLALLIASVSSSNEDLRKVWRDLSTSAVKSFVPDLRKVLYDSLEQITSEENTQVTDSLSNCLADLLTLANSTQHFKLIGEKVVNVSGLGAVIDAAGKPPAGLLQGAYSFRGNLEECKLINVTLNNSPTGMSYCYLTVSLASIKTNKAVLVPLKEELCLPASCNNSAFGELFPVVNEVLAKLDLRMDPSATTYECYSLDPRPITYQAGIMIAVCVLLLTFVILSSFVDLVLPHVAAWREQRRKMRNVSSINGDIQSDHDEYSISSNTSLLNLDKRKPNSRISTFIHELSVSFSLYKNLPAVMATKQPPTAITSLNGIRVISMFWVIFCHVFFFLFYGADGFTNNSRNIIYIGFNVLPRYASQVIINGFLSVDSFFFLGGVLVSYLTMREMKRRDGRFPYLPFYLHRILRLTPTYMFVLFFYWFLTMYLAQGTPSFQAEFGPDGPPWQQCSKYWWTNLLYINNFYPDKFNEQCMGWGWYMANDFQFFVITPLIIIPLFLSFPIGLLACGVLFVASFAATGFVTGYYNLPATQFFSMAHGDKVLPGTPNYSDIVYEKPYCRIGPYLVGLILGAIFYYDFKPNFPRLFRWLLFGAMWVVSVGVAIGAVYGLHDGFYGHIFQPVENITYTMFSRTGWGVALAILVYICHNGYGGPINSFLSMPFWVPLSRMTFNAYLVHPMILSVIFGSQRDTLYYTDIIMTAYIISSVVLSFGAALILSLCVEFPVANIEMAVFKVLGVKLRESTRRVNISVAKKAFESSMPINS